MVPEKKKNSIGMMTCIEVRSLEFKRTLLLLLLLSHFSHVHICGTPYMAAHQAPPSLWFSRQEHWSGLPFPSPMHESEKWKWKVKAKSLSPVRLLVTPWTAAYRAPPSMGFSGKSTGVGCHCLLWRELYIYANCVNLDKSLKSPQLFPRWNRGCDD